ncbi:unnamed protein product [Malus baccata var. baccata]
MQGEGIRCLKLFHSSIYVVLILLHYCNLSLSLGYNNVSSGLLGRSGNIAKAVVRCIDTEREALLAFKDGVVDCNNCLSSWGRESHKQDCCASWEGVYCNNYTGHVVKLDLSRGDSLGGQISSQVGNLTHLQYLDLGSNHFTNAENLNAWLPRLSSLSYLDLSSNNLNNVYGWLEAINKLPKLTNLILSHCVLPSPLIHSSTIFNINSSKSLVHVDLSYNQFTSPSIFFWLSNYNASLVRLDLSHNQLVGLIPHVFGNTSSLAYLDLSYNQLTGSIPNVFGSMSSLAYLDLSYNQLNGSIPDVFGNMSFLVLLRLSDNQIEGGIQPSFSRLCNLQVLDLSNNILSGRLSWLVQILMSTCHDQNSLETLILSDNHLSGSIPNLTNFSLLKNLYLSENQLSGTIPESIGHMSKLEIISLEMNALEGVVSESHFYNLSRLLGLGLSSNSLALSFNSNWIPPFQLININLRSCMLGPHFPKWLQTQKSYLSLDISNAGISDILPSWFWDGLPHNHWIDNIDLSSNRIRGIIPNSRFEFLSGAPPHVNLSWNQLEGPIPSFLSTVSSLDVSNNKLSELSSFLCPVKVSNLDYLDLSSNNLYGQLPDCWMHFGKLMFLDLGDNALFGKIPTTMSSLFSIETLKLNGNGFVGELPSSLKNCTSLIVFDVGENNLSGLIPEWLGVGPQNLTILVLRSNHFYGGIPLHLCNLKHIQILDLSINYFSGSIPKCFNNLTNLAEIGNSRLTINHEYGISIVNVNGESIQRGFYVDEQSLMWKGIMSKYRSFLGLVKCIHLSSNRLTGEIPNEITDLVGLVSLNLSRNNLTGQITPEIGKLASLQSLDLSRNQIYGRIPVSLLQIYGLGFLDLSYNNLFGKIPMGTQLQNYDPSCFAGNPQLCGIPLQQLCPEETSPKEQPVFRDQVEEKDEFITLGFYVSLALGFAIGFWGVCGSLIFIRSWRYTYYKFLNYVYDWLYVRVALIRQRRMVDG